jgi:hypothetical protein
MREGEGLRAVREKPLRAPVHEDSYCTVPCARYSTVQNSRPYYIVIRRAQ